MKFGLAKRVNWVVDWEDRQQSRTDGAGRLQHRTLYGCAQQMTVLELELEGKMRKAGGLGGDDLSSES